MLFLDLVCKLHGFPQSLVFDRDPVFISMLWRELFRLSGTKLKMSTSYHPETDDQTKFLNRTLEQHFRSFVHNRPTQWYPHLTLAEWCYNMFVHLATSFSPFEVTYGKPQPSIPQYVLGSSPVEAINSLLNSRHTIQAKLQRRL